MISHVLALVLAASPAPLPRIAVLPLSPGEGVTDPTATAVGDAMAAELRKLNKARLVTSRELEAVLSVERQKQLAGCSSTECLVELAGALDVDQIIIGTLSRLGESWMLQVQRVDASKGTTLAHASRRKRGGTIDDLLDDLPVISGELFAGVEAAPEPAPIPKVEPQQLPPPHAEVKYEKQLDRAKIVPLADAQGNVIFIEPFSGISGPFFAGDGKRVYAQRVFGGGSEGDKRFNLSFWDPRARNPGAATLDFKDGKYSLTCGDKQIEYARLTGKRAKSAFDRTQFFDVRWRRHGYALARDDEGNHFYVDQAREPRRNTDFRLYIGSPGALTPHPVEVLAHDEGGDVFRAGGGKLKLNLYKKEAEWIVGEKRTKLTFLPVEMHAQYIYTGLGAYRGMPLGTPCDPHF